jgi:hypothetical protein
LVEGEQNLTKWFSNVLTALGGLFTAKVIHLCLVTFFKSAKFCCDQTNITISIDHGKGHSWATLNVIPDWRVEDGSWDEESHVFTLANAWCKKDNTGII